MKPDFPPISLFIALRNSAAHFFLLLFFFPSLLCFRPVSFLPRSLARSHLESARDQQKALAEGLISAFVQRQPASVLMTKRTRRRRRPFLFLPSSSSETPSRAHTCQKYKHAVFFEREREREKRCHGKMCAASEGGGGRKLLPQEVRPSDVPAPLF